jgi:hypothetical protein
MTGPQGRPMKRSHQAPTYERWFARRNPAGLWVIVDDQGRQPLRSIDPVTQLYNLHLAAAAPSLEHELAALVRRFLAVCRQLGTDGYQWNERYTRSVFYALIESRPLYGEVIRAENEARQGILSLELDQAA